MKALLLLLVGLSWVAVARGEVRSEMIEYKDGNTVLEGYLAYDDSIQGKRPGVLVIHQWKGVTDYEKKRADMLARLGYVAFAADVYGKGIRPKDNKEAAAEAGKYKRNRPLLRSRVRAGLAALRQQPLTDPKRVAAIGYCFGGTAVIELARSGAELGGVVSFHGGLDSPNPDEGKNIRCKVLALHGADDPNVPAKDVAAFEEEMRRGKVDWQLIKYGGAVHSFTDWNAGDNPARGSAYNAKADRRSWEAMRQFLEEVFSGRDQ